MDFWIGSAFDAKANKLACDSLRKVIANNNISLAADSIVLYDAGEMKRAKNETIAAQTQLATEYKTGSEKKDKKIKAWKLAAISAWVYELIINMYYKFHGKI